MFDIREPALLEHRRGYTFLRSGLLHESMTYWVDDTGPTPKGYGDYLRWLVNKDAITFFPEAVSLRGHVGRQLLALPEQRVEKAHRRRRARSGGRRSVARRSGVVGIERVRRGPDIAGIPHAELGAPRSTRSDGSSGHRDRGLVPEREHGRRAGRPRAAISVARGATPPPSGAPRDLFVVVDQPRIERHLENEQDLAAHLGIARLRGLSRARRGHSTSASGRSAPRVASSSPAVPASPASSTASVCRLASSRSSPPTRSSPSPTPRGSVGSSASRIAWSSGARSHPRGASRSTSPPSYVRWTRCATTSGPQSHRAHRGRRLLIP